MGADFSDESLVLMGLDGAACALFFFQNEKTVAGAAMEEFMCNGEAGEPSADDNSVQLIIHCTVISNLN